MIKLKLVSFKLGKETASVKNRLLGQRICKTWLDKRVRCFGRNVASNGETRFAEDERNQMATHKNLLTK